MGTEKVLLAGGQVHVPQTAADLLYPPINAPRPSEVRMAGEDQIYLPQQHVRRGVAGYKIKGDPRKTTIVDPEKEEPKEEPRKRRRG